MRHIFKTVLVFWSCAIGFSAYAQEPTLPTGRLPLNEREGVAVSASISGTVVSRDLKLYRLEALPGKSDNDGCVSVAVKAVSSQWEDTYNYKVCSGLIFEESVLERDMEDVIRGVAQKARKYGLAQAAFQGSIVKGSSFTSGSRCEIAISIFKGKQLTEKRVLPCE